MAIDSIFKPLINGSVTSASTIGNETNSISTQSQGNSKNPSMTLPMYSFNSVCLVPISSQAFKAISSKSTSFIFIP